MNISTIIAIFIKKYTNFVIKPSAAVLRKTVTDNAKCAKNSPAKRMRRAKRQAEPKILLNLCAEDQYFLLILPEVVFSNGSFLT